MKTAPLVRYVSPFGSPAWMSQDRAIEYMERDDARWVRILNIEAHTGQRVLSDSQRQVGPPRIEVHHS